MTSDLLIAKSNKPFSDLILFDHTIAFHAVYLSLVRGAHTRLALPFRMPASLPFSPALASTLLSGKLIFCILLIPTSQRLKSLFLSVSVIASLHSLLKAISLPYFPPSLFFLSPFLEEFQCHRYSAYLFIFCQLLEKKTYYISKPYQKFILNRTQISPKSSLTISLSSSSSLFHGSGFLPRFLLL